MRGFVQLLLVFGFSGVFANIGSSLYAGQWDRAIGPARTVENAARDLRRRLERVVNNRYSIDQAVRLERTAGEMVNLLQINSSRPGEVQHLMNELEAFHTRVQSVVLIEANRRNDHALRAQADHLARRVTELQLALRRTSIDPLDCGVAGGRPYGSGYGDRPYGSGYGDRGSDRFDSRYDSRFDSRYDSRFDSRNDSCYGDDWNQHYDDSRHSETRYYRSSPGGVSYGSRSNFGVGGTGIQGAVQTRNGRVSISIGR